MNQLRDLLRRRRQYSQTTHKAVAQCIGRRSPSTSRDIEEGKMRPSFGEWAKLLELVGATEAEALEAARADGMTLAAILPLAMREIRTQEALEDAQSQLR